MHPAPSKKIYWLVMLSWVLAGGFLIFVNQVSAQERLDVGIQPFLPLTGLASPDIRVVIASIIKAILGLLGLVVLILMLYGGFVWMTAGGNEEKVTTAKKILTNAVIGLVIVLSAYAITSFVILQLERATGIRGGPPAGFAGPGAGVGGLPPEVFVVKGISPQGKISIRNVVVRINFSRNLDQRSVEQNIKIRKAADASSVAGAFNVREKTVQFTPQANCPAPNGERKCFDANTEFIIEIGAGLKSLDNKDLICGLGGSSCRAVFITGDLVDVAPPQITLNNPIEGQAVSADAVLLLEATATDDAGIAQVRYLVNDQEVDIDTPTGDVSPTTYKSTGNWDTAGLAAGSTHAVTAKAEDLDNNEVLSGPVNVLIRPAHCFNKIQDEDETAIDCGGKSCGACSGQVCTKNSDCSAGVCLNGRCLDLPTITNIDPPNGAPGNYLTIQGTNFGRAAGEVIFLGNINNLSDDKKAVLAACRGAWGETQVIVEVPAGALTGPIRLATSAGLFDLTSDARGYRGDFLINNIIRPGLCAVSPTQGESGAPVSLEGKSFGDTKDIVLFGGAKSPQIDAWAPEKITGAIVPTVKDGKVAVAVAVKNEKSNAVEFDLKRSLNTPIIDAVNPAAGPVGQYVTIKGSNFGAAPGTVKFINVLSGAEILADVSFPQTCANDYWHDDYIVVKVPSMDLGSAKVKVIRENKESNGADFTVNRGQATPGICKVDPDNGPVSTTINIYGERFGQSQGKVRFFDRQETGRISLWTDTNVKVDVPPQTRTGPMQLIDAAGTLSNAILFTVGVCGQNSCLVGEECCGNGSCQKAQTCVSTRPFCTYTWLFGTGALADPNLIPRVIEDESCRDGNPQSPSPYLNSTDACANGQISARFNKNMKDSTLNPANIFIQGCNVGNNFNPRSCQNNLKATLVVIGRNTNEEGFILKPARPLAANTWYQVTIKSSVQSEAGINLAQDYVWHFRGRTDGGLCAVDFVEVVPAEKVIEIFEGQQEFSGLPTAANCNLLDPDSYRWSWLSSDPSRARVEPDIDSTTIATALAETEAGLPVRVAGAIPSENRGDFGNLIIDFGNPQVVLHFPSCQSACVNAKVGAQFNLPMNPVSINAQTVKLFTCQDEACGNLTPLALVDVNYDEVKFEVELVPGGGLLEAGKNYRAVILGGAAGVKGRSGTTLIGLNFSSVTGPQDSYSWTFKSSDQKTLCAVDRVRVAPLTADLFLIGAKENYAAEAISPPDSCDPNGQRLNSFFYNWAWLSSDLNVAVITNLDVLPKNNPDQLTDPQQIATAEGEGKTNVSAITQGKAGQGELNVICGFERDGQCPPPATLETHGVGVDTCCRPRPRVAASNPADGSQDVCRNALIGLTFNQLMFGESLLDNFALEANYGSSPCPQIEGVDSFPEIVVRPNGARATINWCRWPGTFSTFNLDATGVLFKFSKFMEPNREYRVKVRGDPDLRDDQKVGVLSAAQVAANGDHIFKFNVGTEICRVENVNILVAPQIIGGAKDLFQCSGRNDCPSDQHPAIAGNQHSYFAQATDRRGNLLAADYQWTKSGTDNIELVNPGQQMTYVTTKAINGESDVTVVASGQAPTGGQASRSQKVEVFLCENPWPNIATFPYADVATNFSLFYCRDSGQTGLTDDLPDLAPAAVKPGVGDLIKEFLFIIR